MAVSLPLTADSLAGSYLKSPDDGVWRAPGRAPGREFSYSDGDDVEERLLAILREASDLSTGSEELERQISDFPSAYHLSGSRSFLLRPVAGFLQGRVLEIGAGCGALTRFLGETAVEVVAVEGSGRRAAIAAERCRDLPNVAVVAEAFSELGAVGQFDAVTLVGVLEYARRFAASGDADPVTALLARARSFLKPGGTLLVAIENQLGLKYFAAYPEDHLGEPLAGIENRYGPDSPVTFGRAVLQDLLAGAKLCEQQWFFPFPDYKFPSLVVTEPGTWAQAGDAFAWAIAQSACRDLQRPEHSTFALQRVWPTLLRNGMIPDLANSFLVVASDRPVAHDESLLATYFGGIRSRSLQKETRFVREAGGSWVRRTPLYPGAAPAPPRLGFTLSDEPLWHGRVLEEDLVAATGRTGWSMGAWIALLAPWFAALRERFALPGRLEPALRLPARAIDALPRNLVLLAGGGTRFIDQEWQPEGEVELGYILFRAFFSTLLSVEQCAPSALGQSDSILQLVRLGFDGLGWELSEADLRSHVERESAFQSAVNGAPYLSFERIATLRLQLRPDLAAPGRRVKELEHGYELMRAERDAVEAAELERRTHVESEYRRELAVLQERVRALNAELARAEARIDDCGAENERLRASLLERVRREMRAILDETERTQELIQSVDRAKLRPLKRLAALLSRRASGSPARRSQGR